MADRPPTTSVRLRDEDWERIDLLMEQTGLNKSALVRHLLKKAALGEEGDQTEELRKHVAALAKLVL